MSQRPIKFRVWNKLYNMWDNTFHLLQNGNLWSNWGGSFKPDEDFWVTQFTGLYDKNGKEIWEGDIVNVYNHAYDISETFTISWEADWASYNFENKKSGGRMDVSVAQDSEIIGNIFENPELIGEHG